MARLSIDLFSFFAEICSGQTENLKMLKNLPPKWCQSQTWTKIQFRHTFSPHHINAHMVTWLYCACHACQFHVHFTHLGLSVCEPPGLVWTFDLLPGSANIFQMIKIHPLLLWTNAGAFFGQSQSKQQHQIIFFWRAWVHQLSAQLTPLVPIIFLPEPSKHLKTAKNLATVSGAKSWNIGQTVREPKQDQQIDFLASACLCCFRPDDGNCVCLLHNEVSIQIFQVICVHLCKKKVESRWLVWSSLKHDFFGAWPGKQQRSESWRTHFANDLHGQCLPGWRFFLPFTLGSTKSVGHNRILLEKSIPGEWYRIHFWTCDPLARSLDAQEFPFGGWGFTTHKTRRSSLHGFLSFTILAFAPITSLVCLFPVKRPAESRFDALNTSCCSTAQKQENVHTSFSNTISSQRQWVWGETGLTNRDDSPQLVLVCLCGVAQDQHAWPHFFISHQLPDDVFLSSFSCWHDMNTQSLSADTCKQKPQHGKICEVACLSLLRQQPQHCTNSASTWALLRCDSCTHVSILDCAGNTLSLEKVYNHQRTWCSNEKGQILP